MSNDSRLLWSFGSEKYIVPSQQIQCLENLAIFLAFVNTSDPEKIRRRLDVGLQNKTVQCICRSRCFNRISCLFMTQRVRSDVPPKHGTRYALLGPYPLLVVLNVYSCMCRPRLSRVLILSSSSHTCYLVYTIEHIYVVTEHVFNNESNTSFNQDVPSRDNVDAQIDAFEEIISDS